MNLFNFQFFEIHAALYSCSKNIVQEKPFDEVYRPRGIRAERKDVLDFLLDELEIFLLSDLDHLHDRRVELNSQKLREVRLRFVRYQEARQKLFLFATFDDAQEALFSLERNHVVDNICVIKLKFFRVKIV